jgi:ankyrin repeat protein
LHDAASQQATALVERILELGATADQPDRDGNTALCHAVRRRDESTVAVLLRAGANPNARSGDDYTVLTLACSMQMVGGRTMSVQPSLVERLLEAGAEVNLADGHNFLPLHLALAFAADGNAALGLVDAFLKRQVSLEATGADPMLDPSSRRTALINAMITYEFKRKRDPSVLKVIDKLLNAGARVDHTDPADGKAALHHAAKWGSEALCALLMRHGADRLRLSSDGLLPMHFALAGNFSQLAQELEPGKAFRWRHRGWLLAHLAARAISMLLLVLMVEPLLAAWRSTEPSPTARWVGGYLLCVLIETYVLLLVSHLWRDFRGEIQATFRRAWGSFGYLLLGPALVPGLTGLAMLTLRWGGTRSHAIAALIGASDTFAQTTAQHSAATFFGFGTLLSAAVACTLLVSSRVQSGRKMLATNTTVSRLSRRLPTLPSLTSLPLVLRLTLVLIVLLFIIEKVFDLGGSSLPGAKTQSDPGGHRPKSAHLTVSATTSASFTVRTPDGATCVLPADTRVDLLGDTFPPLEQAQVSVTVSVARGGCARRLGTKEVILLPSSILKRNASPVAPGHTTGGAGARAALTPIPASAIPSAAEDAAAPDQLAATTATPATGIDTTRQKVQGNVTDVDPNGWPIVAGHSMRLHGIATISPSQRTDFRRWLAGHGDMVDCSLVAGNTYRCLVAGDIDVSEAVLMNGAGIASLGAPPNYRSLMVQAQLAKRGQWSQGGH